MSNFYVYGLYDPITNLLFYVGKGNNYRDKSHLKPNLWKNPKKTSNPFLYYKIKSLMENDTPPIIKRIKEDITENEAYEIEHKLIIEYGRRFNEERGILFNISNSKSGPQKGILKPWSKDRKKEHINACKKRRIYDPTYEELYKDYIENKKSRKQIAKENNCSIDLVKKRLFYYGIIKPKELIYPKKNVHICIVCSKKIETPKSVKIRKYCSRTCMNKDRS